MDQVDTTIYLHTYARPRGHGPRRGGRLDKDGKAYIDFRLAASA